MPNPLSTLLPKLPPQLWPRLRREVVGLAQDFWKDGDENPFARFKKTGKSPSFEHMVKQDTALWRAEPGEVAEIMWGEGFIHPGGHILFEELVGSLNLTDKMKVLNLSAGLGGGLGALAVKGATVDSFESTPAISGRCKAQGVTFFDPASFSADGVYDVLIARDFFWRLPDRPAFFAMLGKALNPTGRIAFTDYIVNPEHRGEAAVAAWSHGIAPPGLVDMAEGWAKAGFVLNVTEDLTARHKQDLTRGLKKLAGQLAQNRRPDGATKRQIARELQSLTVTLAALDRGLKFYRFAGTRL